MQTLISRLSSLRIRMLAFRPAANLSNLFNSVVVVAKAEDHRDFYK